MKLHGAGQLALPATALASFTGAPLKLASFTPGITEKTAAFKKLSPSGKQPVIVDDDSSVVIDDVEVLKKVAAGELYPEGEVRAAINEWFASSSKLAQAVSEWLVASGEQRSSYESVVLEVLESAEAAVGKSSHVAGAQLTAADVTVAAAAAGFYFCGFTPEVQATLPKLTTFFATLYSDAKFKPLIEGLKSTAPGATDPAAFCLAVELKWTTERTRSAFIEFFEVRYGHPFWASSPVVPHNDPTLLFTNAGMNQYKAIFLGTADPGTALGQLTCAANSQKCIRAGGKHNDLDDVGKDVYHHTFFEMLGNWSFGNYFKDEAIRYAWELLTEVYRLDPARLYATYFEGDPSANLPPDEEARDLWLRFLPAERIIPGNKKDNFWEMGDQGPCGPCTEIHYDRIGGRLVPELVNMDDPNVLEIWNVVFIQFNREASGQLLELPAKHVDTGMGLERIASVLVDKLSNYATDAFSPIFDAIQAATKARPYTDKVGEEDADGLDMAYRVVADHIRTLSFAIADGAAPGAEGRDYVLRRVLRRAVRYGDKLGGKLGFFSQLVRTLVDQMGYFYPELVAKEEHIRQTIAKEETAFGRTLKTGAQVFAKKTAGLAKGGVLDGAVIFELYDAYGYPVDLTELMAEELGLTCDMEGFENIMEAAKAKSRARGKATAADTLKFQAHATAWLRDHDIPVTDDSPKFNTEQDAEGKVMAIMTSDRFVDTLEGSSDAVGVVLDKTSFYAFAGGQTTDTGALELPGGSELAVAACETAASYVLHKGILTGKVSVGDAVKCRVDWQRRAQITPNHTMTHVLNHALRDVCGEHVDQKGSDVQPEKFTFDFSNNGPVSVEQLRAVQEACQKSVKTGQGVFAKEVSQADAMKIHGLRAVFGEAYPDPVRVVSVGKSVDDLLADPDNKENYQFSVEFCGGTHMKDTSEAKNFAVVGETAQAQGIRRITAVTADKAEEAFLNAAAISKEVGALQEQSDPDETAVKALMDRIDRDPESLPAPSRADIKTQLEEIVKKVLAVKKAKIAEAAKQVKAEAVTAASKAVSAGAKHLVLQLDLPASVSGKAMPEAYTAIKAEHPTLACLMLAPDEAAGKCSVYTEVPKDVSKLLSASEWLKRAVGAMGGKGGGKPEKAAGSGPDVTKVAEAVQAANAFAETCLAAES